MLKKQIDKQSLIERLDQHCKDAGGVYRLHASIESSGLKPPTVQAIYKLLKGTGSDVLLCLLVCTCGYLESRQDLHS